MSVLLVLATLCAVGYLGLTIRAPSVPRSLVKTASVALLAAAAASLGAVGLALALGLCALGDWFLSRPGDRAFMAGVGFFAAGHLAYVWLFLSHPASDPSRLAAPAALAGLAGLALFGAVMLRLLVPRAGTLALPVALYVPIILAMGVAAMTLPPAGSLSRVLPAALAFMASDAILAVEKFVLPARHRARRPAAYAVWTLYWGAQAGFLAGLGWTPLPPSL